jgi:HK97 family phage portal protein
VGLLDVMRSWDRRLSDYVTEQRGITPQQVWGTGMDDWFTGQTAAGVRVDVTTAFKLPVFRRCVSLLSDDISPLPADVFRRTATGRTPIAPPAWMLQPTDDPNYTWQQHIADAVWSYATDQNIFIRAVPDRARAEAVYVLDPENVDVRTDGGTVTFHLRRESVTLTAREVIHVRAGKSPGKSRATSSVDMLRETIALGLAAEEYGARFFSNGSVMQGMIEAPAGAQIDAQKLKKEMERDHKGASKSHAIGVLVGATFKPITVDADKSQLYELKEQVVEDVARGFGIPPFMVGSTKPGAVAYASTTNAVVQYVTHAVVPIVDRLERAYSDLVPGADTYVKLNLNALLRGDQPSRFTSYQVGLASRFMKVDEVRALEDWEPFGEANGGGFLDTPNNTMQPAAADATPPPAQRSEPLAITVNTPPVSVTTSPVDFHVPKLEQLDAMRAADLMVSDTREQLELLRVDVSGNIQSSAETQTGYIERRLADIESRLEQQRAEAQAERERVARIEPVTREVTLRDDHGRPLKITERRGERTIHKMVDRDERGAILRVTEVAA